MKKQFLFVLALLLTGCTSSNTPVEPAKPDVPVTPEEPDTPDKPVVPDEPEEEEEEEDDPPISFTANDYGAFLGRSEGNYSGFDKYKYVSFELDEFSQNDVKKIHEKSQIFAYLNVGSLENYRSYYNDFKDITFADYDNWPDERWIDVSNSKWQTFIVNNIAKAMKDNGADGVYMDNVDVYSVCKELKRPTSGVISGLKNIIKGVNDLGLKVMVNGGAEFFDDMFDKQDNIFDSVFGYHQEEVFSLITDYDNDKFGTQEKEDSDYYKEIAAKMKAKGKEVFFLEYTKSESLIKQIDEYCSSKEYHYYVSSTVDLK